MHIFELELKYKIKTQLTSIFNKPILGLDVKGLLEKMTEEKMKIVNEFLKNIIAKKQDAEIAKFQDVDLKVDLKKVYLEILEEKKNKFKKKDETTTPNLMNDEVLNTNETLQEKKPKPNSDDLSNLTFLKHIRKLLICLLRTFIYIYIYINYRINQQLLLIWFYFPFGILDSIITSSKIKLLLQYLRNIDESLYKYLRDLTDEFDKDNLIIILIELKLFLRELISYYKQNYGESNEIIYEHKIYTETNVINRIFKESTTLKMLYTLGLLEIKISSYETVIMQINNVYHIKQKLLESFLKRLIDEIKLSKKAIIID